MLHSVTSLQAPRSDRLRPHLCVCRVRLRRAVADAPIAVHEHVPREQHDDKHAEPEEHEREVLCRLRAEQLREAFNGSRPAQNRALILLPVSAYAVTRLVYTRCLPEASPSQLASLPRDPSRWLQSAEWTNRVSSAQRKRF